MWQARLREAKSVEEVDKYEEMLQNLDKQAKSWSMRAVLLNLIVITCFFVLWSIYSACVCFSSIYIFTHSYITHLYIMVSTSFVINMVFCLQRCSIGMSTMVFYQNDILSVINGVLSKWYSFCHQWCSIIPQVYTHLRSTWGAAVFSSYKNCDEIFFGALLFSTHAYAQISHHSQIWERTKHFAKHVSPVSCTSNRVIPLQE